MGAKKVECKVCNKTVYNIGTHESSKKHIQLSNSTREEVKTKVRCISCDVEVTNFKRHETSQKHLVNTYNCKFNSCNEAINGQFKTYSYDDISVIDPVIYINKMTSIIRKLIEKQCWKNCKLCLSLHVEFYKNTPDGFEKNTDHWFNSGIMYAITDLTLLPNQIKEAAQTINEKLDLFTREGSGWIIKRLLQLDIKLTKYKPLKASSYIELPKKYQNSDYKLINIKNSDNQCFKWCIARSNCLDQANAHRVSDRVKSEAEKYDWSDIHFPVKLPQITKFENQNPTSVNVYGFDEKLELYPLRITKQKKDKHVNLLMISKDSNNHYILMKDLSPFVDQKRHRKSHVCIYCLHSFTKKELLDAHEPNCSVHSPVKMIIPEEPICFTQYAKTIKHPFTIYADFESTLQKISTVQPDPNKAYINNIQKHIPNSFCCYTKCELDGYSKLNSYYGIDSPNKFVDYVINETKRIYNILKKDKPMNLSNEEKILYKEAQKCYVCHEPFTEENWKVRDHNHLTGAFRGAAHNKCNLIIRNPKYIPVFLHNLSKYDAHLFVKEFGKIEGILKAIPQTDETYISFSQSIKVDEYEDKNGDIKPIYREIRFLDSFRFMSSSLDKLASNLHDEHMSNLMSYYPEKEKFSLLRRKGVYPYEWVDTDDKFKEEQLPSKKEFYSELRQEHITDFDYNHANDVWKVFNCKTFKDYHMLYLQSDTLLLADVFENFRKTCITTYNLDPVHYYTAPGLSWDALLKQTNVKLDLIQDPDMLLFIEKGIRGGISTITHRYAKANNPYIPKTYDSNKPKSYITYLDANNLYGYAMQQYLPTGKFKWLKNIAEFDVGYISDTSKKGYILEVDMEYPTDLHDDHNDYPLAAENVEINKVSKLTPNLNDKSNYIIHYRNLKQCLELGLKLKKIHRILEFDQSSWMKSYIDLNTSKRTCCTNEFEKDFYKLMNNAVFGKTMENIRNRVDIKLVKNSKEAQKLVNKPNFKSFKIFCDDLIACHMIRTKLVFNKPIYVGMAILELSKTLMYDFHYKHIKKKYKDKSKLLFTDTDSLCYHIQTNDIYKDMKQNKKLFDTSNFNPDHFVYNTMNKKVVGKFKDESPLYPIEEFVGLRSKLYAFSTSKKTEKRAKGISKAVVKNTINMEDYKNTLFEKNTLYRKITTFKSKKHEICTTEINKKALCGDDDKRFILKNNIDTLAHGNYRINSGML